MPYILSRASEIVFISKSEALAPVPQDLEKVEAIGIFIENLKNVLEVYLAHSGSEEVRKSRSIAAFEHLMSLSSGRM
jgi:hypothetical protein